MKKLTTLLLTFAILAAMACPVLAQTPVLLGSTSSMTEEVRLGIFDSKGNFLRYNDGMSIGSGMLAADEVVYLCVRIGNQGSSTISVGEVKVTVDTTEHLTWSADTIAPGKAIRYSGNTYPLTSGYHYYIYHNQSGSSTAGLISIDSNAWRKGSSSSSGNSGSSGCALPSGTRVGQSVFLGRYEQDNNIANGKERIEWIVLEIRNGHALLISKYCLDAASFHSSQCAVTWASSDLRRWLNDSFYYGAFSSEERSVICSTNLTTGPSAYGNKSGGPDTTDKVFCLSINEANSYFSSDSARQASLTAYAAARTSYNWWWLRSPGGENDAAKAIVNSNGQVTTGGNWVTNNDAVRPCIWVDLQ